MTRLTNQEFIEQIDQWQQRAAEANVTLPSGKPLEFRFYHVLLGIVYSNFKSYKTTKDSKRPIPLYICKQIRLINKLSQKAFINELNDALKEYIEIYGK